MRILILLTLLSIFSWAACSDVEKAEERERLVNDEIIASSMSAFLSSQRIVENSFLVGNDLLLGDFDLNNLTDICGSIIDTNFVLDIEREQIDISANGDLNLTVECNNLNIPSAIKMTSTTSGSYTRDYSSGTFEQSSHYEGLFDIINLTLSFSGVTGRMGMLQLDKDGQLINLLTSFNFNLEKLDYNLATGSIVSGSATAIVGFRNEDVKENYVINIDYLGNSLIILEFNNKTFEIDLSN